MYLQQIMQRIQKVIKYKFFFLFKLFDNTIHQLQYNIQIFKYNIINYIFSEYINSQS